MEKFIFSPYQWVLKYVAKLEPGFLGSDRLECGPRLKGNLIHRLSEALFNQPPPEGLGWLGADKASVREWVKARWDRLLEEEGSMLLVPGRLAENTQLQHEAVRALSDLVERLRGWGAMRVVADYQPPLCCFCGGRLVGRIDLLVETRDGRLAVVDLKYGGEERRREQIVMGRPLQLAVYAHLLAGEHGRGYPAGAFYILATRALLTRQPEFFGDGGEVTAMYGSSDLAGVWSEVEEVWKWRRSQLDAGWIELTVEGSTPTSGEADTPVSIPDREHWAAPEGVDRFSEYVGLTGFPPTA
jgi:hypothetical protein